MDIRAADSQKVEVCTDSCPIETWTKPPVHPEISLYLYAESNIAVASAPFWLTLTFTNQTKHSVSLETLENSASTYRLYAFGRCACPGALGKLLSAAGMLTPRPRLRRGGTFTEKIDLGKLMDLSAASPWGPTYRIGVRRFDMTRGHENSEVISNLITVTVMPAPR